MNSDSAYRKTLPMVTGVLDYFPAAIAEVAKVSRVGNEKHNPSQPLHWSRGKSSDHADCIARHLVDRGDTDPEDGQRHSAKVAWRALALLQEELEAAGEEPGRGSKFPEPAEILRLKNYDTGLYDMYQVVDHRIALPGETIRRQSLNREAQLVTAEHQATLEPYDIIRRVLA